MQRGKSKGGKRLAIAAALLCAAASVKLMATPNVRRPVAQFIHFYEQSQTLIDNDGHGEDMSLWDRVLYSLLMTKTASS